MKSSLRLLALGAAVFGSSVAPAQVVDPSPVYNPYSDQSPFVLLHVPKDGVAYYQRRTRAQELHAAKNWQEAEPLLEGLVKEYTRDPVTWRLLGEVKSSLGKHLEAAAAFERTGLLAGWDLDFNNGFRAAASYYAAGDRQKAFAKLREMLFERHALGGEGMASAAALSALREDPEFLKLLGRRDTSGWSREEGWTQDIEHLYREVKRVNPDYRNRPFPAEFDRRYGELKRNIARLSDEEIFVGLQRMLAVLHQGHTGLWVENDTPTPSRRLPLRFYVFPEGIHVIDADEGFKHLIGAQVLSIGSLSAEEALRRVNQANSSDGDMEHLLVVNRLIGTYTLKGIGAIKAIDSVPIQLRGQDGAPQNLTLPTVAAPNNNGLPAPSGVPAPLFLKDTRQNHWEQLLPERDALYVQVNLLMPDQDETLPQFGERLWSVIEKSAPKNLILDLRHNGGGNTQSYPQLLRTLVAFSRKSGNQLYVLIGRQTYSAAGNLITDLERLADPVFVGEASSECCNLYGDATSVILPYSRVRGRLTALKWQLSTPADRRREISPEVPVQLTAKAYFAGEDPALEAVFSLIGARLQKDQGK